ncbi:MAG: hypothetical protein ACM3JG_09520 [Thiohalocapsa sp.]
MSGLKPAPALLVAAALAGCSALDPYPTAPAAAPTGAIGHRVAICYNTLTTPLAAVEAEAQQECAAATPRTIARPAETDWYLQNCPLLLPARATFACMPAAGK